MEAIVLAGGFGTRLNNTVPDVPKPMAPVCDRPFLEYILDYLIEHKVDEVILAIGYKGHMIQDYFGDRYKGLNISYSIENSPLGTGGAIKQAMQFCDEDVIFILNGDTYFDVDLDEMKKHHHNRQSRLTIAVKRMKNFDRYGSVIIDSGRILQFKEKQKTEEELINGGIYLIDRNIFDGIKETTFSFEQRILESSQYDIYSFESKNYFIDIGIPEDYAKAQQDFLKGKNIE